MELLSEVVQSCSLNEAEIEQQRSVVLRELEEVEGNGQEVCLDMLHATAFQGTPLGHSVLGPSSNARWEQLHVVYFIIRHDHRATLNLFPQKPFAVKTEQCCNYAINGFSRTATTTILFYFSSLYSMKYLILQLCVNL